MVSKQITTGRFAAYCVLAFAALALLLFLPAGRLDWWEGWVYIGLIALTATAMIVTVGRKDPELGRRRMETGAGTKGWDLAIMQLVKLGFLATLVTGGLDGGQFGWSTVPIGLWSVGAVLQSIGYAILGLSMLTNTHFETTVRIQTDREHRVVDTGPYRIVRHPGYAGFLLALAGTPLLLRSLWAYLPAACLVVVIVVRTALEDRTLHRELDGYAEFADRVRWRLIPGIW